MHTYKRFDHLKVIGYSNSNFARCMDTRKSTLAYVFLLARGEVSCKSAKQYVVTKSIMEVEL